MGRVVHDSLVRSMGPSASALARTGRLATIAASMNLWVASNRLLPWRIPQWQRELWAPALAPEPDMERFKIYWRAVFDGWGVSMLLRAGLPTVGIAYLGNKIDGQHGNLIGLAIGLGPIAFCFAAETYSLLRYYAARRAYREYKDAGDVINEDVRRLIRIARIEAPQLVVQLAAAITATATALAYWV